MPTMEQAWFPLVRREEPRPAGAFFVGDSLAFFGFGMLANEFCTLLFEVTRLLSLSVFPNAER